MKSTDKFISFILLSVILISSCAKNPDAGLPDKSTYLIKSLTTKGINETNYLYNSIGKISEEQSFLNCYRYSYDDNNRLVKEEYAFRYDSLEPNYIMTSQNSTFVGYHIYEYDQDGKLNYIKDYSKHINDSVFEYYRTVSLDYENGNIVRKNELYVGRDSISDYTTYTYDDNRNLINEKYYSNEIEGPWFTLLWEYTYRYDNNNNPYRIYKERGIPGLYTNANNILESNEYNYHIVPGKIYLWTRKYSYEYNDKGFPFKGKDGITDLEYAYY
jgi:hypothetical protein